MHSHSTATDDVAELAQAGEQMESELDELALKVTSLTTERDNIIGKSERQEIELTSLTERMEREQGATGKAQVELALEKLKLIDFQKRDLEQRSEIDCKNSALDAENKARVAAEQLAAVLDAKHENARELVAKADSHIELLSKQLADGARELQAVRSQSQAQQAEHASITREQQEAILQAQRASAEAIQQVQRSSVAAQEAITAAKGAERESASAVTGPANPKFSTPKRKKCSQNLQTRPGQLKSSKSSMTTFPKIPSVVAAVVTRSCAARRSTTKPILLLQSAAREFPSKTAIPNSFARHS